MSPTSKEKAKECCQREFEQLVEHLKYCNSPSRTSDQKHHCYRFAAWHSGRRARKCIAGA